ncbi:hypothetical protein DL769_005322 [Monosporascus sp. CRB-8-3]|nr:hypothetical protein DL769_005322 [Monosporascus sp. CRB-8-3]
MKPTTMLISTLAAVASAAPAATESRGMRSKVNLGEYNDFSFANDDLQYLNAVNKLDMRALVKLSAFNNLDISGFKEVFVRDEIDIEALLQLQQIALLIQLADAGLFDDFDLAIIEIDTIDLGLLSGVGDFDVASLIDDSLAPKLQAVIKENGECRPPFARDEPVCNCGSADRRAELKAIILNDD